jgi:hypothetical protein
MFTAVKDYQKQGVSFSLWGQAIAGEAKIREVFYPPGRVIVKVSSGH